MIYLRVKPGTLMKRLARGRVPLGDRISYEHLKAVVKTCEHFFFSSQVQ